MHQGYGNRGTKEAKGKVRIVAQVEHRGNMKKKTHTHTRNHPCKSSLSIFCLSQPLYTSYAFSAYRMYVQRISVSKRYRVCLLPRVGRLLNTPG